MMRWLVLAILCLCPVLAAAQVVDPGGVSVPSLTPPASPDRAPAPVALPPRVGTDIRRGPGVTTVDGHTNRPANGTPAFQYFVLTQLQIGLTRMGTPGEVRLRLESLPRAGEARATCRFTTADARQTTPAVIAPDGTARLSMTGFFQPARVAGVTSAGRCRLEIVVERRQVDLSYRQENRIAVPELPVAAHDTVVVRETARLRGFLRPVPSAECQAADQDGAFGMKVTAGVTSTGCRTDFLHPRNPGDVSPTLNELPPGVILSQVGWRLEGSLQACELCDKPLAPCRGVGEILAMYAEAPGMKLNWVYAPISGSNMAAMPGEAFAVFGGPPVLGTRVPVRVDTRTDEYDTSFIEYLERMNPVSLDSAREERDVIGVGDGLWRSWMRPFAIRMQCSSWAPPPGEVLRGLQGAVLGGSAQPPAPPSLRLVLTSMTFLRPAGTRVPGE